MTRYKNLKMKTMEIKYNVEIEVTKEQYVGVLNYFKGIVAFRKTETQYFIKLLFPAYRNQLTMFLSK